MTLEYWELFSLIWGVDDLGEAGDLEAVVPSPCLELDWNELLWGWGGKDNWAGSNHYTFCLKR